MNVAVAGFEFAIGVILAVWTVAALRECLLRALNGVDRLRAWWKDRRNRAWRKYPSWLRDVLASCKQYRADDEFHMGTPHKLPQYIRRTASDVRSPLRDPHLMLPIDAAGTLGKFRPSDEIVMEAYQDPARMGDEVVVFKKPKP